jgi:hypothetical protein
MRPVFFTLLILFISGATVTAQLSILPQVGIENSKTSIHYNDFTPFTPLGGVVSPQLALRVDYKFKKQHGPFAELSTSRSLVSYEFSDPENGMKMFKATPGDMQLRFEAGYQFSSKPFYFSKAKSSAKAAPAASSKTSHYRSYGNYYSSRGHCGRSVNKSSQQFKSGSASAAQAVKEKGWYMAVQPLIGAAVTPAVKNEIIRQAAGSQASYLYNAGNWNTALVTGAGFEFGQNVQKKFVITFQYLKGLGNLNNTQLTTMTGAKESVTQLRSDASAFSIKAGIPITLSKKKTVAKPVITEQPRQTERKCGEYKSRCTRAI